MDCMSVCLAICIFVLNHRMRIMINVYDLNFEGAVAL